MKFGTLRFRVDPDVNSARGFTEALVTAAGGELTEEAARALAAEPDRSVSAGLTEESPESPAPERDDQGRFAAAPQEPVAPVEGEDPGAAPQEPVAPAAEPNEKDPAFQEGYLRALGENSERLGEERARREALEQRLSTLEAAGQTEPVGFASQEDVEQIETLYEELGGPGMMARVASSQPHLVEDALDVWFEYDPRTARKYEREVDRLLADTEQQGSAQPAAPQLPAEVQAVVQRERLNAVAGRIATEVGKERAQALAPHIGAALEAAGPLVREAIGSALSSDDPEKQQQAMREVISLAETRATAGAAGVAQEQRAKEVREQKQTATLGTGSQSGAAAAGQSDQQPRSREEFEKLPEAERKALATKLVATQFEKTETTSVRDGLTYGPTP